MTTIYEVNFSNTSLQVANDLVFGWTVRSNETDCEFVPVTSLTMEQLKFLQSQSWPAYIPNEFRAMVARQIATLMLLANPVKDDTPVVAMVDQPKAPIGEARSVVVDSWLKIYQLIVEKMKQSREYMEDAYVADLGYCKVVRHVSGKWHVANNDRPEKSKDFENVQEAVFHIARVWW